MADFPGSIYEPRIKENRSGIVYDATKPKIYYAEDVSKLDAEVVAIENYLSSDFICKTVEISSAEILALYTNPKTLIDAPGRDKIIIVDQATFFLNAGTIAYTDGGVLYTRYADSSVSVLSPVSATFVNSATNVVLSLISLFQNVTIGLNREVVLTSPSAQFFHGNGTIEMFLQYRIVTL